MPIDYQRDDRRRLITVTVTEPFSFDELLDQADRQSAEHTWDYAILYDSRTTVHRFPPIEIQQMLARTEAIGQGRPGARSAWRFPRAERWSPAVRS